METSEVATIEKLQEKLKFRRKVERAIGDISTYLVFSSSFNLSIEYFLSEIAELYHFYFVDGAAVCLFDEPSNDQISVLGWNSEKNIDNRVNLKEFPIGNFIWFQNQIKAGRELVLTETYEFSNEAQPEKAFFSEHTIKSLIAIPIFTPEYIAGTFVLVSLSNQVWQEEDLRTLRLFAELLGTAIFRKKTEETLSKARDYLKAQIDRKTEDLSTEKQRIELILNTIKDGVIVLDQDGKVTMANETSKRFFNLIMDLPLIIGVNLVLSTGNTFFRTIRGLFLSFFKNEVTIEPKKGLHLQIASARGKYPALHTSGMIIELRDVTAFIEFDNMRKRFVSTVSHELRTPITVINQSINNYEKYGNKLPEKTKTKLFSAIARNSRLLYELVEDLLLISKIDERRIDERGFELHWQDYDIKQIIDEVTTQLEPRAKAKDINILKSGFVKAPMFGDPNRVAQIFRALIDNAIKYSGSSSIIRITGKDDYTGKYNTQGINGILVKVIDSGIGIDGEDLPKVFNRFFRAKSVSHISGTGLGLGIARDLVKMHKGELFVESALGKGTITLVFLPRITEAELRPEES